MEGQISTFSYLVLQLYQHVQSTASAEMLALCNGMLPLQPWAMDRESWRHVPVGIDDQHPPTPELARIRR